jgi:predicted kinase
MLARGALGVTHVDALAARVAAFHGAVAVAGPDGPYGRADEARRLALDNCDALDGLPDGATAQDDLAALRTWIEREGAARHGLLEARRRHGFVRECHGDLHCDNIALVDDRITIFDCIEFNDHLRWGDVMGEVAFTTMDLADRGRPDLGWRFLDAYLEETGDYEGLGVHRFFFVYRAMVRAKVTGLRAVQCTTASDRAAALAECRRYLALARQATRPPRSAIVLMHGLSGSGKTTRAQRIVESVGAVRIRTDVERKRLHGLERRAHDGFGIEAGPYAPAATMRTYERVRALAGHVTAAGFVVVVDGAFLARWQRDMFRSLAAETGVPFAIVTVSEPLATLRARLIARAAAAADASDADTAVLEHQVRTQEPLASDEQPFAVACSGEIEAPALWLEELRGRLVPPPG